MTITARDLLRRAADSLKSVLDLVHQGHLLIRSEAAGRVADEVAEGENVLADVDAHLSEPCAPMSEEDAARLDAAFVRMRKQRDSLKERLFGALQSDPILKEGLEQVDHAQMIDRMTYSRVLDVACAQKARADEAEAKLAALSEPDALQASDAARWRFVSDRWQVSFTEGRFTSFNSVVSEEWRKSLNAQVDRMMAGDWSDPPVPSRSFDSLYEVIRGTGYVTRGQAIEITNLVLAAAS